MSLLSGLQHWLYFCSGGKTVAVETYRRVLIQTILDQVKDHGDLSSHTISVFNIDDFIPGNFKSAAKQAADIICSDLSNNKLCIGDSRKIVYLFQKEEENITTNQSGACGKWKLVTSFYTGKRILKLQFDFSAEHLILTDKCGDVYVTRVNTNEDNWKLKKILGHCSLIQDTVLGQNNDYIFTADRDHKIRCSRFPDAHRIEYFLLGHTSAVTCLALFDSDKYLISFAVDGGVRMWCTKTRALIKSWDNIYQDERLEPAGCVNIKNHNQKVEKIMHKEFSNALYIAVIGSNSTVVPVLELIYKDESEPKFRTVGQVPMGFVNWGQGCDNHLYSCYPTDEDPFVVRSFSTGFGLGLIESKLFKLVRNKNE